jgi:anti-sigma factor RsiW
MKCEEITTLFDGYGDGELDLVNHLAIESHLAGCSHCAIAHQNLITLKKAFLDDDFHYRAPAGLRSRLKGSFTGAGPEPRKSRRWNLRWTPVLAAAALAAILIPAAMLLRSSTTSEELIANEVVSAHIRSMMVTHLTDVQSTDQHTVKPWFEGKLDFSPPVADLTQHGFELIGGRLDYAAGRPVAALVYQRRQHVINLFVFPSPDDSDSASTAVMKQGFYVINWKSSGMVFWAVSDLNQSELLEFARALEN